MKARLRAIHTRGLARGLRPQVLAKIGDSITVDGGFLTELGCGGADLGTYAELAATIAYFGTTELAPTANYARCGRHNSWTRVGPAARVGWSAVHPLRPMAAAEASVAVTLPVAAELPDAADAPDKTPQPEAAVSEAAGHTTGLTETLAALGVGGVVSATATVTATLRPPTPTPPPECQTPGETALGCEIKAIRPGVAIVMFGTNDLEAGVSPANYQANLDRIVGELIAAGVLPLLSTIPPRADRTEANARVSLYNMAAAQVAAEHGIPLINYWRALTGPDLIHQGLDWDGIHPKALGYGATFDAEGLRYGLNQRNLTLLQTLDKIRRIVYEDGPPEG